ncbi:hypothetical protein [Streptomyces fungicidicus]
MPADDRTSQEAWRLLADWHTPAPDRPGPEPTDRSPSASDDRSSP